MYRFFIIICAIFIIISLTHKAKADSTSFNVTMNVPVFCQIINNQPSCNLILTKLNSTTWIDSERGYIIHLINKTLTIEGI